MTNAATTRRDPLFGCLVHAGRLDDDGYGRVGSRKAHIVAWEAAKGPVPDGMALDHLCRNRACVALHHLEPVTHAENERRKKLAHRSKRERCPRGHEMRTNGVITPEGGMVCRLCNQEAARKAA